jgi:hypothetical protein
VAGADLRKEAAFSLSALFIYFGSAFDDVFESSQKLISFICTQQTARTGGIEVRMDLAGQCTSVAICVQHGCASTAGFSLAGNSTPSVLVILTAPRVRGCKAGSRRYCPISAPFFGAQSAAAFLSAIHLSYEIDATSPAFFAVPFLSRYYSS